MVIDELGRMELYSALFRRVVTEALDSEKPMLGTIQVRRNPFLDSVRARDDVRLVQVTANNRDALVESVTRDLLSIVRTKQDKLF